MKKFRWISLFVLAFLAVSCGGGGGGGAPGPPPVINVPSATVYYPYNNMLVGGLMTVEADVYDGSGISRVELLINGATIATDSSGRNGTYNLDFNADALATGVHNVRIRAWNKNSAMGESSSVPVRVDANDLRKQALSYLRTYNAEMDINRVTGVRRWASLPIKVEVSPQIGVAEVADA
ncbi:MAG: Ig-like domain-containing protein, partial [Patescibacteria group bacterium]